MTVFGFPLRVFMALEMCVNSVCSQTISKPAFFVEQEHGEISRCSGHIGEVCAKQLANNRQINHVSLHVVLKVLLVVIFSMYICFLRYFLLLSSLFLFLSFFTLKSSFLRIFFLLLLLLRPSTFYSDSLFLIFLFIRCFLVLFPYL